MVKVILGEKRFLVSFQDGCENNISSNQPSIMIVEKILEEKESEFFTNHEMPEEKVKMEKI